jgi:DNA-binding MarR family transcriptional regulator
MPRADRKLFRLINDDVCRDILELLLDRDGPRTQVELTTALDLNSGTISRRLANLEDEGVVERSGPRGTYVVVFPSDTRELLLAASGLAKRLANAHAQDAEGLSKRQRTESLAGGRLHDMAREEA